MSDLVQQAEELGIKVDGRWSDERLQQEIDKKLAEPAKKPGNAPTGTEAADDDEDDTVGMVPPSSPPPPPEAVTTTPGPTPAPVIQPVPNTKPKEKQIDILLKADYWPVENDRREAGSLVKVPMSKAKELIAQGKAEVSLSNLEDE